MDIKDLRLKKGWTQKEAAARMEVSTRQFQKWEGGEVEVPERKKGKLRDLLTNKDVKGELKMNPDPTSLIEALMNHKVTGSPIHHDTIDQIADELNSIPKLKAERAALYKALNR